MIVDVLENLGNYISLNKYFDKAFKYIQNSDFKNAECGRYVIDDNIYVNVEKYITKTVSRPEYHKNYIDIQMVVEGEEKIGYCPLSDINNFDEFDYEKDIGFSDGDVSYVKMNCGKFMILFPQDAHQPCMALNKPNEVKKVVIKVRVK